MRAYLLAAVLTACGGKPKLDAFHVDPPCVCKGGKVTMVWSVENLDHPAITADPKPRGWTGTFDHAGSASFPIDQATKFHIDTGDANAADAHIAPDQSVEVVSAGTQRDVLGPTVPQVDPAHPEIAAKAYQCDDTTVTGPLPIVTSCAPATQVKHGASYTGQTCLIPPTGAPICIDGDKPVALPHVVVDGTWKLRLPKDAGSCSAEPRKLTFDIDCGTTP